jgi:integrase
MAGFTSKMTSKGEERWRYHIHRKGFPTLTKGGFKDEQACRDAATIEEANLLQTGQPTTIQEAKKHTVADMIDKFLKEKDCSIADRSLLKHLRNSPLAAMSLAYVQRKDAYAYLDKRSQETRMRNGTEARIDSQSIARSVAIICSMFNVAAEKWGWTNRPNPFSQLKIGKHYGKVLRPRTRRLKEGELDTLIEICEKLSNTQNRLYIPLAINLAIETGMRKEELLNLRWADIDLDKRLIQIEESKTDKKTDYEGRTIVMTVIAKKLLETLWNVRIIASSNFEPEFVEINQRGKEGPEGKEKPEFSISFSPIGPIVPATTPLPADRIFPMSYTSFSHAFQRLVRRADIYEIKRGTGEKDYLHFHDLRREADCRFRYEAKLEPEECDLMMGHNNRNIRATYLPPSLIAIRDKLDRDQLGGLTETEWTEMKLNKAREKRTMDEARLIADRMQQAREDTERRIEQTAKIFQLSQYRRRAS